MVEDAAGSVRAEPFDRLRPGEDAACAARFGHVGGCDPDRVAGRRVVVHLAVGREGQPAAVGVQVQVPAPSRRLDDEQAIARQVHHLACSCELQYGYALDRVLRAVLRVGRRDVRIDGVFVRIDQVEVVVVRGRAERIGPLETHQGEVVDRDPVDVRSPGVEPV